MGGQNAATGDRRNVLDLGEPAFVAQATNQAEMEESGAEATT